MENEIKKKNSIIPVMSIVILAVIALIVIIVLVVRSNSPEQKLRKQLELGEKYLSELQYEQAIAVYQLALDIDPKSVDAYLGMAEAYIGMGEYETALELLNNGYMLTQDMKLADKMEEIKSLSGKDAQEENKKTEELYDGGERTVVDGIIHHEYESMDLSSEQTVFLDSILDQCEKGDPEGAVNVLHENAFTETGFEIFDHVQTLHLLYKEYKIYIYDALTFITMYIIPVDKGKGYMLSVYDANFLELKFGSCECEEGIFNGEFVVDGIREEEETGRSSSTYKGKAVNGLIDGVMSYESTMEGRSCYMSGDFVMGKARNIRKEENGGYSFMFGEWDDGMETCRTAWLEDDLNDYYFYVAPGEGYSKGNQEADGLDIYPY